jgi:glyoxylase I family protein
MPVFKSIIAVIAMMCLSLVTFCAAVAFSQDPPSGVAPPGDVLRPGHLGREIGDIEKIIHFYHDLLGTDLRGPREQDRPFVVNAALREFADVPMGSEFRAVILPIPGTAASSGQNAEMTVEAIEYRNVKREPLTARSQDPGASHLGLVMRDLDATLARLKGEGVPILTPGEKPVALSPRPGLKGKVRAIVVRDPDGYPVELIEQIPPPETTAAPASRILGAHITLAVDDLEATQRFYRDMLGPDLKTWTSPSFVSDKSYNELVDTPGAEIRLGTMLIPGSPVSVEFMQYRNIECKKYRPEFWDIGVAHLLFMVKDMDVIMPRIKAAKLKPLNRSGDPVFIAPTVRAIFVRDPNGLIVEFMERK